MASKYCFSRPIPTWNEIPKANQKNVQVKNRTVQPSRFFKENKNYTDKNARCSTKNTRDYTVKLNKKATSLVNTKSFADCLKPSISNGSKLLLCSLN